MWFGPLLQGGAQSQAGGAGSTTLSPPLIASTSNVLTPAVSAGPVGLAATLLTNAQTFYAPVLGLGSVGLAPGLLTNTSTIHPATVSPGAVGASPILLANTQAFYGPTVTPSGSVSAPLLANDNAWFVPAVTAGSVAVTPPLFTNTSAIYAGLVSLMSGAAQDLAAPLLVNARTFFPPYIGEINFVSGKAVARLTTTVVLASISTPNISCTHLGTLMTTITRKRGDTYPEQITVINQDTRAAIDITGCSFVMTVDPEKTPASAANNLFALTGTLVDAVNGVVEFVPSELQVDQTPGTYYYDIQLIDGAGRIRTIALDKWVVQQDISK